MMTVGVDLGTTTVCAVTLRDGEYTGARTLPGAPMGVHHTQDPAVLLERARMLTEGADRVGVTGQMHGILYVDRNGNAVSPLYTWQNTFGNLPRGEETCAGYLSGLSGYPLASGYGIVTHVYLQEHGEIPENAVKLCTIGDYIAMKLTGRTSPLLHASNAASLGCFDLRTHRFDTDALARIGVDPAILPDVTPAVSLMGHVAVGDNQASFRGSVSAPDTALLNLGTGGQLSVLSAAYLTLPGLETRPYDGGRYLLVAASLCGGRAYAVLERFFRLTLAAFGVERADVYKDLERIVRMGIPERPLTADTALSGTRADPSRTGSVSGITEDNLTPGALIDAFLRGIAEELKPAFDTVSARLPVRGLCVSGNAVRRNAYLREVIARVYGLPVAMPRYAEEAAYGAALFADGV